MHWQAVVGAAGRLLALGGIGALGFGDDAGAHRGGLVIGLVVEHGGEPGAHVMLDVIGEHAQEDVGAHARRRPVEDRTQMDVDGLQGAERALDLGKTFVGADSRGVIERFLRQAGAHDINSVQRRLGGDRRGLAMEREVRLADDEVEVLGHLVPVDDGEHF